MTMSEKISPTLLNDSVLSVAEIILPVLVSMIILATIGLLFSLAIRGLPAHSSSAPHVHNERPAPLQDSTTTQRGEPRMPNLFTRWFKPSPVEEPAPPAPDHLAILLSSMQAVQNDVAHFRRKKEEGRMKISVNNVVAAAERFINEFAVEQGAVTAEQTYIDMTALIVLMQKKIDLVMDAKKHPRHFTDAKNTIESGLKEIGKIEDRFVGYIRELQQRKQMEILSAEKPQLGSTQDSVGGPAIMDLPLIDVPKYVQPSS